jgi:hypothetical protein
VAWIFPSGVMAMTVRMARSASSLSPCGVVRVPGCRPRPVAMRSCRRRHRRPQLHRVGLGQQRVAWKYVTFAVCGDRTIARTSEVHSCAAETPVSPADVKGSTAVRPNRGDGHRMLPTRVRRFSRQSGTTVMSAAPTSPSTITSGRRSGRQRNHLAASRSPVPRLPTPQRLRPPR